MIYADFAFYKDSFFGTAISEDDFPRLASRASQYLDYYTMGRAAGNSYMNSVKMACCALAERYQVIERAEKTFFDSVGETGGLKSESVGSYSVSYQTSGEVAESAASAAEAAKEGLAEIVREYLAGTNLLYRGRCCRCMPPTL